MPQKLSSRFKPYTPTKSLTEQNLIDLYFPLFKYMLESRFVDRLEEQFTARGEAFFHVSGAGHEAMVALHPHLISQDYLHPHYRDKALMIARGVSSKMFFHSLFCKDQSHSRGRQMSAHISDPERNILSMVGPVGNNALQAAGVAMSIKNDSERPIVLCAMGDGTTQEGECLEAIAEAVRWELPVLFVVEDNQWAISTKTKGKTFFSRPDGDANEFYGIPITRVDGHNIIETYEAFGKAVTEMRQNRKPKIILFKAERLSNHTNADDQRIYRTREDIEKVQKDSDPIAFLEKKLLLWGLDVDKIQEAKDEVFASVKQAADESQRSPDPKPCYIAKKELPDFLKPEAEEYTGNIEKKELTMLEAIRQVLNERMALDSNITLYGEDIEDPKGDVFGLTRGLTEAYPTQVLNSPLTESSIVGMGVGRALAGDKPVVFLQFADFLPIAFNQIVSEMGSIYWRTDGAWQVPLIVMITCGGYRPGLGPFHAQTFESLGAHTPGVDVMMPSTAGDAAGLLNAAFESGRPTLYFYPKSCLNEKKHATSKDTLKQIVPIGKARFSRHGKDITLVCYGNLVNKCNMVADALESVGMTADVIDLRSIFPWDKKAVIESVAKTGRLLVTHEDNHTAGMGAEIISTVAEALGGNIKFARCTRPDTYVPCNFDNQLSVLPSYKSLLTKSAELLDLDLIWEEEKQEEPGLSSIDAIGTSPSDETISIIDWKVKEGQFIEKGQLIAEFEANKASSEMLSPMDGKILAILVSPGEMVDIGTPLLKIKTGDHVIAKPITQEKINKAFLKRRHKPTEITLPDSEKNNFEIKKFAVGLASISTTLGSRKITNQMVLGAIEDKTEDEIVKMTGIETRYYVDDNEDVVSLAVKVAKQALIKENLKAADLDMVIVTTGTPLQITPSLACLVLSQLGDPTEITAKAMDINAACSGYLYALQSIYDFIQSQPDAKIMLITSEVLSPLLDLSDFNTSIIFGDAATATILYGEQAFLGKSIQALVKRPTLSSRPENGQILSVPLQNSELKIHMNGKKVFSEAVKKMTFMLEKCCIQEEIHVHDLDLIVPHQANQRIIEAIQKRIDIPENKVFSNIKNYGNTSSNTIPIALSEALPTLNKGDTVGLCAFGGGFTFSAGILEVF